jgi:cytochrome c oxidase cbb3-type subunit III
VRSRSDHDDGAQASRLPPACVSPGGQPRSDHDDCEARRPAVAGGTPALLENFANLRLPYSDLRRLLLAACCSLLALVACNRERRALTVSGADARRAVTTVRDSKIQPGSRKLPAAIGGSPYEGNAYAISQGQQLFDQYNCSGCHFHGGGGIGPPLMDDDWVYGSSPANIYESISEGRPNGMPSFGGHIPDAQIWQLVAFVRSVGGLEGQAATAPRVEGMQSKITEEPK